MATTNKKEEQIFIGNDDMVVELTGEAKAEFIAERDARESAIKKLAEIAGLTKEELASIL